MESCILKSLIRGGDHGEGRTAVIVMPRAEDWRNRVKVVVLLTEGAKAGVKTSHSTEFFANTLGCLVSPRWNKHSEEEEEDGLLGSTECGEGWKEAGKAEKSGVRIGCCRWPS